MEKALIVEIRETLKRNRKVLEEIQKNNETLDRAKSKTSVINTNNVSFSFSKSGSYAKRKDLFGTNGEFDTIGPKKVQSDHKTTPVGSENLEKVKKKGRQSSEQQQWLKKVVFRTLDTFFRIPTSKSPSKRHYSTSSSVPVSTRTSQVGLNTLRFLSSNEADESLSFFSPHRERVGRVIGSDDSISSTEVDDDKSWEYVDNVLSVKEVTMSESDSLEQSSIPSPPIDVEEETLKETTLPIGLGNAKSNEPRLQYKKRTRKENGNKIRRRIQEKQSPLPSSCPVPRNLSQQLSNNWTKWPDLPTAKKETKKLGKPSFSLPNLTEQSFYESSSFDGYFAECNNVNSFKRGALKRPSSTMKKNFHEEELELQRGIDDYLCSSSSSFNSFVHMPSVGEEKGLISKPSALLKNFQILPIYVPIEPIRNEPIKVLSESEFSRRFGVYELVKEVDKDTTMSPTKEVEGMQVVEAAFDYLLSDSDGKDASNSSTNLKYNANEEKLEHVTAPSMLSASMPPPPPPPPMPTSSQSSIGTLRYLLPLPVYTQLPEGNSIFNEFLRAPHELGEEHAKHLKKKFPLDKKSGKSIFSPQNRKQRSKLKLNIEMFLKTWGIIDLTSILDCISVMNPSICQDDKGCFAALIQIIPNGVKGADVDISSTNNVDVFLCGLHKIERLKAKLRNIQFSIDFPELYNNILARIELFIDTCNALNASKKFMEIIEVLMAFLTSYCAGEGGNGKIYGFDILSLNKLATKVSPEDESTTWLHILIEYILKNPSKCEAVDFHQEFKSLSDPKTAISKLSLDELEIQVKEWRESLVSYEMELDSIRQVQTMSLNKLEYAKSFHESSRASLKSLSEKLVSARSAFNSCKERYGLTNPDIKENQFFDSIAQFIGSFQRIHGGILAKEQAKRSKLSRIPKHNTGSHKNAAGSPPKSRRSSCGPAFFRNGSYLRSPPSMEKGNAAVDELDQCLQDMLEAQNNMKHRGPRQKRKPII